MEKQAAATRATGGNLWKATNCLVFSLIEGMFPLAFVCANLVAFSTGRVEPTLFWFYNLLFLACSGGMIGWLIVAARVLAGERFVFRVDAFEFSEVRVFVGACESVFHLLCLTGLIVALWFFPMSLAVKAALSILLLAAFVFRVRFQWRTSQKAFALVRIAKTPAPTDMPITAETPSIAVAQPEPTATVTIGR